MKSQQYPSEVNVLSKRVNRLSNGRQLFPVERVNFFRMDRQMLKKQGLKGVNRIQEKTSYLWLRRKFFDLKVQNGIAERLRSRIKIKIWDFYFVFFSLNRTFAEEK